MLFMLIGIVFFSQIMTTYINIIKNYEQRQDDDDRGQQLNNWMTLIARFTGKPSLKEEFINQIDRHFSFYWNQDRLASISKDNEFLNQLPK